MESTNTKAKKAKAVRFEASTQEYEPLMGDGDECSSQRETSRVSIQLDNGESVDPVKEVEEVEEGPLPAISRMQMLRRMSTKAVHFVSGEERRTSQWSIVSIRKEFREADIEDIYKSYWLSQQGIVVFKLLCILAVYNIALLCLHLFAQHDMSQLHTVFRRYGRQEMIYVVYLCSLVVAVILGSVILIQSLYQRLYKALTLIIWLYLLVLMYLPMTLMSYLKALDNVTVAFGMIFITHTMLPTSRSVAVAMGTVTMVASLSLVIALYYISDDVAETFTSREFTERVIADALVYLGANLIGFYLKHFTDIQSRRTFLETRRCINGTIKIARRLSRQDELRTSLLLKIIPKHLLDNRDQLLERLVKHDEQEVVLTELMLARHNDVSILYADIVSFTPLTADMEPHELVLALNELFGRFDELAKENKCLRIKILGDCYYCVSGLPNPTPSHARNCVIMGMKMIKVIEHIRHETGVETLNMRIGIHTGWVLSGLIGDQKWQYDVWSDDVTLANHMESGGKPGKVHITQATKEELNEEFGVEPGCGGERDQFLKERNVQTFFIADSELQNINIDDILENQHMNGTGSPQPSAQSPEMRSWVQIGRRKSIADCIEGWGAETPFDSLSDYMMEKTIPEKEEVKRKLKKTFNLDNMENQKCTDVCCTLNSHQNSVHSEVPKMRMVTLKYTDKTLEEKYCMRKDDSFPFYVSSTFLVFLIMSSVQLTLIRSALLWATILGGMFIYVVVFVAVSGLHIAESYQTKSSLRDKLSRVSEYVTRKNEVKICCSILCSGVILLAAILPVYSYGIHQIIPKRTNARFGPSSELNQKVMQSTEAPDNSTVPVGGSLTTDTLNDTGNSTTEENSDDDIPCLYAPYFVFSCLVALVACNLFLRVNYLFKTLYMIFCLVIFNVIFYLAMDDIFEQYDFYMGGVAIPSRALGSFHTALLFVILVVLDRQIESHMRVDYLNKTQTEQDQVELDKNDDIKDRILCNILPRHVADHFLDPSRDKQQLYHHQYKNACVMFAAIPGFEVFFSNVDVVGVDCLRLLNEIISGFDSLLKEHTEVEKIKTIGSTYLAATGLHLLADTSVDESRAVINANAMAKFALAITSKLAEINYDAFCSYSLRIGINHGGVIAGVVGAQKPVYDIWGDAVNVASRMESHGTIGKIQVPKETAQLLEKGGLQCEYHNTRQIKGKKEPMDLYFILDNNPGSS